EDAFRDLVRLAGEGGTRGILHMACHGTFVTGEPLNSGLLLTGARVDAAELARMRLPFDEVILTACSTGRRPTAVGDVTLSGDDILGLPGALLEAGVTTVLVSITEAADGAARELAVRYHRHRLRGLRPLAAWQATQIEMVEQSDEHP